MAQIWDYGRPFMPRRRSKRAVRAITSVFAMTALLMGLMPAAFASGALDVTVYVQDKTYDGSTTATISTCVVDPTNLDGADTASCDLGASSASFVTEDVGPSKTVNASITLSFGSGNSGGPYTLGTVTAVPAAITAGPTVNVTVQVADKTYDGNTNATVTGCTADPTNVISPDEVTCSTSGISDADFADANVGLGKAVTITTGNAALSGAQGGNYALGTVTVETADITAVELTAVLDADSKTYDGDDDASATCDFSDSVDIVGSEDVTCVVDSADFADANVGTGKTVTAAVSLGGTDAGNYVLADEEIEGTGGIGAATTTVAYGGQSYLVTAGTTTATLSASIVTDSATCELDDTGAVAFAVEDVLGNPVAGSPFTGSSTGALTATATTGALGPGIYTIDVTYTSSDPTPCPGASDAAVLTIVSSGGAANGGGWYRRGDYTGEGSSRANFGFVLNKTYTGTGKNRTVSGYKGQLVWVSGEGWRVKADLAGGTNYFGTFTCPAAVGATGSGAVCGSFQATGALEMWDPALNGGLGDWSYVEDVMFTVTVYDGGSVTVCKKRTCTRTDVADWFGIQIDGYSSSEVPETAPIMLVPSDGKGSIKASL